MGKKYQIRVRFLNKRYYYGTTESISERDRLTDSILNRLEKEEAMGHIVGTRGEILSLDFDYRGVRFTVSSTETTGTKVFDAIDTIKNIKTGELREISRQDLYNLTRKAKKDE